MREKKDGWKAHLFLLCHCEQCQKYYMKHEEHAAIRGIGRAEVVIHPVLEDADAFITSGNEFKRERDHLKDVEGAITEEMATIRVLPDHVSQYATGGYDDGNLNWARYWSRTYYRPRLTKRSGCQPKPYLFRVDIARGGRIGDLLQCEGDLVHSDFGHALISYQTAKVQWGGLTDPFLVRVLRMRRLQHQLTDIFVTIQENQNSIVNEQFSTNVIV